MPVPLQGQDALATIENQKSKTLIVGVGNPLLGDEGVGMHALCSLSQLPMPAEVDVLDCGCDLLNLVSYIDEPKKIIILDAIRAGGKPGRIYRFDLDDPALICQSTPGAKPAQSLSSPAGLKASGAQQISAGPIPPRADTDKRYPTDKCGGDVTPAKAGIETIRTTTRSAHQLQTVDALRLLKQVYPCLSRCRIIVMGIEPKAMELGGDLSQEVRESIADLARLVIEECRVESFCHQGTKTQELLRL